MDYPKLRDDINAFPLRVDGEPLICFQDSQRLGRGALIPQALFSQIVMFFDGQHSIRDIQYEVMRRHGDLVYTDLIEKVVAELDAALLLESPRFHQTLKDLTEDFRRSSVRPAFFAGQGYAADALQLSDQLHGYFLAPDGPGAPTKEKRVDALKGIISPHVDFQRGGSCYAWAYKALAQAEPADLYVILGIAHAPTRGRFIVTRKDFETPLGTVKTDQDFVRALSKQCSKDLLQDEFLHRSEHSIEFQVVFLQSVLGPEMKAKIVPILCGSFDQYLVEGRLPEEDPIVAEFLTALGSETLASHRKISFVSGVDLSHMGPQFGDSGSMDDATRRNIKEEDLALLATVANGNAEGFFRILERDRNERRICGFPAMYVQLKAMEAARGKVLRYGQGPTPDGQSVVSFVAMAFYG